MQALRLRSATVAASDEPDAAAQAAAANRFAAHVYIGFEATVEGGSSVHYYAVPQFESAGGRLLATDDRQRVRGPHRRLRPGGARHAAAGAA